MRACADKATGTGAPAAASGLDSVDKWRGLRGGTFAANFLASGLLESAVVIAWLAAFWRDAGPSEALLGESIPLGSSLGRPDLVGEGSVARPLRDVFRDDDDDDADVVSSAVGPSDEPVCAPRGSNCVRPPEVACNGRDDKDVEFFGPATGTVLAECCAKAVVGGTETLRANLSDE